MADTRARFCARAAVGAAGTIAGAAVQESYDVRLAALWRHDGAASYLHREYRASLINEASKAISGNEGRAAWV